MLIAVHIIKVHKYFANFLRRFLNRSYKLISEKGQEGLEDVNDDARPAAHFRTRTPRTSIKIAWHEPNDMPTSSATSLIVIRRLSKIIFFTASMLSSVVDVLGRSG